MTFSVIIPCYNCVPTLAATVASVRGCGLTDYEIILIDDGSSDGTAELCDSLSSSFGEVRCLHQQNAGVSAARNRGIAEAEGEYIWFVDADDGVDALAAANAADIAIKEKPDMLIFGMSFDYYKNGKIYRRDKLLPPYDGMLTLDELKARFDEFYACNALTPVWNKFVRAKMLKASSVRFRENMILMEDFLFVLDILPLCEKLYSLPQAIYRYRQAEDEKGAYRRLQKIGNLAEYMLPFEQSVTALGAGKSTVEGLYKMLLSQKMYYAPLNDIKKELAAHYGGKYSGIDIGKSAAKIYFNNKKTQLRHSLAVAVKSSAAYQRLKPGEKQ